MIMGPADLFLRQAPMTTHDYFHEMVRVIDDKFGDGYAKAHPELVGALVQTCATDFAAMFTHHVLEEIESSLSRIADVITPRTPQSPEQAEAWAKAQEKFRTGNGGEEEVR